MNTWSAKDERDEQAYRVKEYFPEHTNPGMGWEDCGCPQCHDFHDNPRLFRAVCLFCEEIFNDPVELSAREESLIERGYKDDK